MPSIISPSGKAITLAPVRSNAGIEANYRKRLNALIEEMNASIIYWVSAAYKANEPEMARDDSPAIALRQALRKVGRRWQVKFDQGSASLAAWFAQKNKSYSDKALANILKDAGVTVEFRTTAKLNDIYQAVVGENINLIKSIGSQHLTQVETMVMQSVQRGRNLGELTEQLTKQLGVSKRRAALIARDQNNKATASITNVRQRELGITHGIWRHSTAGKEPRPSHVAANGKTFLLDEGMYLDGEWVLPGQAINCLPGDSLIDLVNGCHVIWRYHYRGDMISLEAGESVIRSTPNHPFLSSEGWVAAEAINEGDYVWKARSKKLQAGVRNVDQTQFSIADVFTALSSVSNITAFDGSVFNFHGDIPNSKVETVRAEFGLLGEDNTGFTKSVPEFNFTLADRAARVSAGVEKVGHTNASSGRSDAFKIFGGSVGKPNQTGLGTVSSVDSQPLKPTHHESSGDTKMFSDAQNAISLLEHFDNVVSREIVEVLLRNNALATHDPDNNLVGNAEFSGNGADAFSLAVHIDNQITIKFDAAMRHATLSGVSGVSLNSEMLAQLISAYAKMGCTVFETDELVFNAIRVSKKIISKDCSTHVYTLQSNNGWFGTSAESVVTKNCRCTVKPIIPGFID